LQDEEDEEEMVDFEMWIDNQIEIYTKERQEYETMFN